MEAVLQKERSLDFVFCFYMSRRQGSRHRDATNTFSLLQSINKQKTWQPIDGSKKKLPPTKNDSKKASKLTSAFSIQKRVQLASFPVGDFTLLDNDGFVQATVSASGALSIHGDRGKMTTCSTFFYSKRMEKNNGTTWFL